MLKHRAQKGSTLSEYGLIGALVALAAVGGLTMFGGSLSKLLDNPQSTKDMQKMAMLNFGGGQANPMAAGESASGGPVGSAQVSNAGGSAGGLEAALMTGGSSGGTNATSAEGAVKTVLNSFNVADRMYALTNSVSSNELADWYRETTRYAYRLVGSEATFSYSQDAKSFSGLTPLLESGLEAGDGLRGMYEMRKELSKKVEQLKIISSGTASERAAALALTQQMLGELDSQYGALLNQYTDGDNFKLEKVKADFGSGDLQYQKDNLHDVAQDILGNHAAGSLDTSLETSVVIDEKTP